MVDTKAIGQRVKHGRKHNRQLSQEELGAELGLRQSAISDLENGKKGSGIYDLHRLEQLANGIRVDLRYLVFGEGSQTLPCYCGPVRELEVIEKPKQYPKAHRDRLTALMGGWDATRLSGFRYLPWHLYFVDECPLSDRSILRIHAIVFLEDSIVGAMTASIITVNELFEQDERLAITTRLPVIRIGDRLDPYRRLCEEDGIDESNVYALKARERAEVITQRGESLVVVIEALEVEPERREHGLARMMIDTLDLIAPNANIWMDLRPTRSSVLAEDRLGEPQPMSAGLGQMHLNASIAERLGFQIDEAREAVQVQHEEESLMTISAHTWAFRLNEDFARITAEDGLFRELLLTKERLAALEMTTKAEIDKEMKNG